MKEAIENIKKFRELKSITREDLADKLEMSLSGYSKLERGEVELTLTKLYSISEILDVSVSQILNFDASQIFNISPSNGANGYVNEYHQHNADEYKEKYIKLLEEEVVRLKNQLKL
jgi:transcriptional regulator with XRE-family HTH domain